MRVRSLILLGRAAAVKLLRVNAMLVVLLIHHTTRHRPSQGLKTCEVCCACLSSPMARSTPFSFARTTEVTWLGLLVSIVGALRAFFLDSRMATINTQNLFLYAQCMVKASFSSNKLKRRCRATAVRGQISLPHTHIACWKFVE